MFPLILKENLENSGILFQRLGHLNLSLLLEAGGVGGRLGLQRLLHPVLPFTKSIVQKVCARMCLCVCVLSVCPLTEKNLILPSRFTKKIRRINGDNPSGIFVRKVIEIGIRQP